MIINGLDFPVFPKLGMTYIAEEDISLLGEIESEEAVFPFRVLSHCNDGQNVVYEPLRDFMKLNRAARRSMDRSSGLEAIRIAGPVIKRELIAIYH